MVDTNPDFDVAAEWDSNAFYQFLMRQRESQINAYLMTLVTGTEPSGKVGNLTKSDKAEIIAHLESE